MWGGVANIILRVLSAEGIWVLWLRRTKRQEGRSEWKDRLKTICGWMSSENPLESSGKENEASRSPGLWKLLAGWKPSYWWGWLISSASQKNAGKGITPGRDVMQQTRLISYKPVVCLFVGGEKRSERNKVALLGNPTSIISVAGRPTTRGLPADLSIAPAHFTRAGFLRSTSLPSLISYQRKEIRSAIERNHVDRQDNFI